MELLRLQEMNYLNMIKQHAQQSGLSHAQSLQAMQSMAPWMQIQRLRAMQQSMLMVRIRLKRLFCVYSRWAYSREVCD